ncbi:unnamed protein product [Ectocarpus sp. 12 AP-2014]
MSSDDDSCGSEDGQECTELSETGLVIFIWMIGGLFMNWFLMIISAAPSNDLPNVFECTGIFPDDFDPGCCCFFIKGIACWIVCGCLGPLPLASLLCWYLWRYLRYLCSFCIDLPRQAARRKTKLAVDRLRRYPGQKRWEARGWLIMMWARRQRSSARSEGWRARLRKLDHYDEANIIKYAMRDFMGGQTPPEIELLEAGRLKMNFVRTVMAVVEMNEEGLFRHIITYL